MYEYKATYRNNYDGDTVRLDIDLGFGIIMRDQVVRLLGIDAPEMRGDTLEAGRTSRDMLRNVLAGWRESDSLIIRTVKDTKEKYGRWLATIGYWGENERGQPVFINVNEWLVEKGYAVAREY